MSSMENPAPTRLSPSTPHPAVQCASAALLLRPASFGYNAETAPTNRFAQRAALSAPVASARARDEFEALCGGLRSEGIGLCVIDDTPTPIKPDAVFPNNWVSFHRDGTVVLYPMQAVNRRAERRREIVEAVSVQLPFTVRRVLDMSIHESEGRYLEGTGSLVLDHVGRVAYACRSARTDAALVAEWSRLMNYEPLVFDATGVDGAPLYHTNVLLCIGARCAIVCAEAVAAADRDRVLDALGDSGREVIPIDRSAMSRFCGNMLELAAWDEALGDCSVLLMSAGARSALSEAQYQRISGCVDSVLAVPVPTIEAVGGGSVRCMLAEVPETRAP